MQHVVTLLHSFNPKESRLALRPLYACSVSAGFPSPADDYLERDLDLNEYFIRHESATFFVRVSGDSMERAGILDNDVLVVDKSLEPRDGAIVIAVIDGELTVKRLRKRNGQVQLVPENPNYQPITILPEQEFLIWGVVTGVARSFDR
jgi:DNA polymerase V